MLYGRMAIILVLFIGLCSIISLDFYEHNLIQLKNSALSRYIRQKRNLLFLFLYLLSYLVLIPIFNRFRTFL